ncbi:hypothetical protein GUITHDRAFT_152262 [Guillardia theta CCMP2712]|uniref:Uncharacterized protein n=1 Tax=Guillardia theta (strain CCMP2712) TaxID=905079 RepID=L1JEN2_GUITC|nr:hypothetical protein GUITHDRAFT_152262 [Guillardia theta CCMP2712]EKX46993.1 hypothetical protein GUITHDRAFT_152262 [Guillardia theta CCMP2712]|eukprot:XP_005833973.1 hypothetical protein GUITHDRAFT_152262 [Guillardia theta CCMP2712]
MALSHAMNKLGPIWVQAVVGVAVCSGLGYASVVSIRKPPGPSSTPEWKEHAKTMPNPLRDPEGKLR